MVPANSLYYAALKWAFEFKNGVKNAKPLKIMDFCSDYNLKEDIYDKREGTREIETLEFIGVMCECFYESSSKNCDHVFMMTDKNILKIAKNLLLSQDMSYTDQFE